MEQIISFNTLYVIGSTSPLAFNAVFTLFQYIICDRFNKNNLGIIQTPTKFQYIICDRFKRVQ